MQANWKVSCTVDNLVGLLVDKLVGLINIFTHISSFRVTPSLVHPFLEGISLNAAIKAKRLFIVDYSILEKADVDSERAVCSVYNSVQYTRNYC